jgi:hypothetical protein
MLSLLQSLTDNILNDASAAPHGLAHSKYGKGDCPNATNLVDKLRCIPKQPASESLPLDRESRLGVMRSLRKVYGESLSQLDSEPQEEVIIEWPCGNPVYHTIK